MKTIDKELLKGIIDILILQLIQTNKEMYGYDITKKINTICNGHYEIKEGTLYIALKRLNENNYLSSYWDKSNNILRKKKYYSITPEGKTYLETKIYSLKWIYQLIQNL